MYRKLRFDIQSEIDNTASNDISVIVQKDESCNKVCGVQASTWGKCFDLGSDKKCRPFIVINIIAAIGHLLNFIFALGFAAEEGKDNTQIKYLYAEWDRKEAYCNQTCTEEYYEVMEFAVNPFAQANYSQLNLFYLVLFFHLLSFVFQMGVAISNNYVDNVLNNGTNIWRFIEYSISASLMLLAICIASGILEANAVLSIGILTFTTQVLGLISEVLFSDGFFPLYDKRMRSLSKLSVNNTRKNKLASKFKNRAIDEEKIKSPLISSARCMGWVAHFTGWVTMLTAYIGIIIMHFYESNSRSPQSAPDFVYAAVWSVFVFYNLFGITQVCQLCLKDPGLVVMRHNLGICPSDNIVGRPGTDTCPCGCCKNITINEWVELFYVILSLSSKTVLGTLILVNALRDNNGYGQVFDCSS